MWIDVLCLLVHKVSLSEDGLTDLMKTRTMQMDALSHRSSTAAMPPKVQALRRASVDGRRDTLLSCT
jgi:hypothetical protein